MSEYRWRLKYNPDQPRVPKGDPRGGQWTGAEGRSIASWYRSPALDERMVDALEREGKGDADFMAGELGVGHEWSAFSRDAQRWTNSADPSAKDDVAAWLHGFPQIRTLTLYSDWSSSDDDLGFREWMKKPQKLYRGGGISHPFMSFARSARVAEDASGGEKVWQVTAPPVTWLGSGMTAAGEVWIETEAFG